MKKIKVFYQILNSGDGGCHLRWFLTEKDCYKYNDTQDEQMSDSYGSVETFEGSDIHQEAIDNSAELSGKHEYLKEEDYYESRSVGTKARSDKTCEHCGKTIKQGTPHEMHHFYPEFASYATHKECVEAFKKSLN